MRIKKWFLERFLPMWAKETVFKDNRRLLLQLRQAQQENERLRAYIKGLRQGVRIAKENSKLKIKN